MKNVLGSTFAVLALIPLGCTTPQIAVSNEVHSFLLLLTRESEPTLFEYAKFSGSGDPSESELVFELKACSANGWDKGSKTCIDFIRSRWAAAYNEKALFMNWVRRSYSTVGQDYRITKIESKNEGFPYSLIDVKVGINTFKIFKNEDPTRPTAAFVGISEINGMKVTALLKGLN